MLNVAIKAARAAGVIINRAALDVESVRVSQKMAEAAASRPKIVGKALNEIAAADDEILDTVLTVMEVDTLIESNASVDLLPDSSNILLQLGSGETKDD